MRKSYQGCEHISGWHWYLLNAFRALNEGLSRHVRHKDDWIVISMTDLRYISYRGNISDWVMDSFTEETSRGVLKTKFELTESQLDQCLNEYSNCTKV